MRHVLKKSLVFVAMVTIVVVGTGSATNAKGPNGGELTVKAKERSCSITALATFDKALYQSPVPTVAIRFRLVDEATNPLEQQSYLYSSRDVQRISHTFSSLTTSATSNTFAVEVQLLDESGQPRFSGGSPDLTVSCSLPLLG